MDLDSSLHSVLNAKETPYDYQDKCFDSPRFWMNTQFMIYHVCGREESLMGILFNKLNKKISIYFECGVGSNPRRELRYDPNRKNLFIKVVYRYDEVYDDSIIYKDGLGQGLSTIESLVRNGYQHAKEVDADVKDVVRVIEKTIDGLFAIIDRHCPDLLEGENRSDFQHLLRVALAYGFPTREYKTKKFTALAKNYYTVNEAGREEEISCGGEFIIWHPQTDLKPLFGYGLGKYGSRQDIVFLLQYSEFQNEVLLKGARETTWQMTSIIKNESVKSARAATMARNLSHNLGSHFISYTKNFFNALIDVDFGKEAINRGIRYALQYIQERMDFIATVTSDDAYAYGAVNAKAQIFDELTPDELGKRHKKISLNFLLDYLVMSERVSKKSFDQLDYKLLLSECDHKLKLELGYEDKTGKVFFWNSAPEKNTEQNENRKFDLVNINFAIPGGLLGRHAVFSILENIIRNAAKHGQDKIKDDLCIKMLCTNDDHLVVYDNKLDDHISVTVNSLKERLSSLKMRKADNSINEANKGLKEILICAVWLQKADFTQVLREKRQSDFVQILAVDEEGHELPDITKPGYLAYRIPLARFQKTVHLNRDFGLSEESVSIHPDQLGRIIRGIKADIICASKDYHIGESGLRLSDVFPRFYTMTSGEYEQMLTKKSENDILKSIVQKNCRIDATGLQMVLSSDRKDSFFNISKCPVVFYDNYEEDTQKDSFFFIGHAGKSKWSKFQTLFLTKGFHDKYIDSISGGDFTQTIVQPSFLMDSFNLWKVYESVKTRFVIIDERIYEQYHSMTKKKREELLDDFHIIKEKIETGEKTYDNLLNCVFNKHEVLGKLSFNKEEPDWKSLQVFVQNELRFKAFLEKDIEQHYLERRDIHIFSFDNNSGRYEMSDLSNKSIGYFTEDLTFAPSDPPSYFNDKDNPPITFMSIHLGLIDKIKESLGTENQDESKIVEQLKSFFGARFVSIHSGRGGLDIRESLQQYVFQSYSAVENPLHNSKFLLSQQFYSLNYYGSKDN